MSILDKASLIQIPSGYKSTKLYSLRPSNGDGDFTFSRSSSATRVNSEGLIEVASVLGSELVTNGDFEDGSTDWNLVGDFVVSGGSASITSASQYSQLTNQLGVNYLLSGKKYKLEFDIPTLSISNAFAYRYTGGSVTPISTSDIVNGKFTAEFTMTTNGYFWLQTTGSFTGLNVEVDNVSVKEVFENDVPRLDYSGGASCASLLLESQATNLVTYSEDFNNAVHTKFNVTITSNNTTSPDGTQNADKFTETTVTGEHILYDQNSIASGTYTLSAFFKSGGGTIFPVLRLNGADATAYAGCIFNTSTGTVVNTFYNTYDAPTTKVENMGNGWYRVSMTTTTTNTFFGLRIAASNSASPSFGGYGAISYTGSISNYFYTYGAQLEQGSYPTSYIISNSGSQTTRTADVCNGAGTSATFNSTEGVLFAEISALANDGTNRMLSLSDGTSDNRVLIKYDNISNRAEFFVIVSGVSQYSFISVVDNLLAYNKIALKYKVNDFSVWFNGNKLDSNTSGNIFAADTLDNLSFDSGGGGSPFYGKTKQLMVFDEALSDEELSDLTGQVNLSFNNLATFYNYTIL